MAELHTRCSVFASMGPRLISRGNEHVPLRRLGHLSASMGPRLISRGNGESKETEKETIMLQWGRD